jgi:hypothetical protein
MGFCPHETARSQLRCVRLPGSWGPAIDGRLDREHGQRVKACEIDSTVLRTEILPGTHTVSGRHRLSRMLAGNLITRDRGVRPGDLVT